MKKIKLFKYPTIVELPYLAKSLRMKDHRIISKYQNIFLRFLHFCRKTATCLWNMNKLIINGNGSFNLSKHLSVLSWMIIITALFQLFRNRWGVIWQWNFTVSLILQNPIEEGILRQWRSYTIFHTHQIIFNSLHWINPITS